MGSHSDWETMKEACEILTEFGIPFEKEIVSAHRSPERMVEFAKQAKQNGFAVIIAGAGGAAHLPGMTASLTTLPVLGVPVQSKALNGMDSLLSIVQMTKRSTCCYFGHWNQWCRQRRITCCSDSFFT